MKLFLKNERFTILCFLILGLSGALFFGSFYNQVSPSASLQFRVSKPQALSIAKSFLNRLEYDLKDYKTGILFQSDETESVFLEKSLGTKKANQFFDSVYAPWYWRIRWFQLLKEEEISVAVSPKGELVGFFHKIPDNQGSGFLTQQQAYSEIKKFFKAHLQIDLSSWMQISHEQRDHSNRRDHLFQWVSYEPVLKKGQLILSCGMQGSQVTSFSKYVRVPKEFIAKEEQSSSNRKLLTDAFNLLYLILGIFVGAEFLLSFKRSFQRWRIPLFIALAMFSLTLISELNLLSIDWVQIDTLESFGHFLVSEVQSALTSALWAGLFALMVAVAAENVQTLTRCDRPSLRDIFSRNYFYSRHFIQSVLVGYSLGALQLGYVAAFYLISQKYFGGWSPLDSPYFNVASSFLPWVFPLTIGLTAAVNEELFFRMFSISFLKNWLKSKWIAILIPALIWGFLHSNYFVEPIYSRGLELALVGMVLGWVYLKYGILPAVLCHYTYNSTLGMVPLLRSESLIFQLSGWIAVGWILFPGILALISYCVMRRKGLSGNFVRVKVEDDSFTAKKQGWSALSVKVTRDFFASSETLKIKDKVLDLQKNILNKRLFIFMLAAVSIFICLMALTSPPMFGPKPELKISRKGAVQIAEQFLKSNNIENNFSEKATAFYKETDSDFNTLLVRTVGVERANEILKKLDISFMRQGVIFYELKNRERITVSMDGSGRVAGFQLIRNEETFKGESLSPEKAKQEAVRFLKQMRPNDWSLFSFKGEKSSQVKNRFDHVYLWEYPFPECSELILRIKILVQGNEIGAYQESPIASKDILREGKEKRTLDTVAKVAFALIVFTGIILLVWDVVMKFRAGLLDWGRGALLGILFLIAELLEKINAIPGIWISLAEDSPLKPWVYLTEKGLNIIISELVTFGFVVFLAAYGFALFGQIFGKVPKWIDKENRSQTKTLYLQGFLLALFIFPLLWLGQQHLAGWQLHFFSQSSKVTYPFWSDLPLNTYIPLISLICSAFKTSLVLTLTIGSMVAFLYKILKKDYWVLGMLFLLSSFQFFTSGSTWSVIGFQLIAQALILLILYLGIKYIFRFNIFFYFFLFWFRDLIGWALFAFGPESSLKTLGFYTAAAALFPLFIYFLLKTVDPETKGA